MRKHSHETAAGLARIEGYLVSQAARQEADREGEAFARDLTWLGFQEQQEIATRFAQHHLRLRKQGLRAIVERAEELETEYSRRYTALRTRLVGLCVMVCALCFTAAILLAVT
ncbi:hypothetical protein ABZ128_13315 [Streptomyces sp. NPDC006326]|uniref:hypothetical protein n=1 Tax=Streptomyces sp. NPDC006326 TaxID=3156752 RepID=UPI0033A2FFDC